ILRRDGDRGRAGGAVAPHTREAVAAEPRATKLRPVGGVPAPSIVSATALAVYFSEDDCVGGAVGEAGRERQARLVGLARAGEHRIIPGIVRVGIGDAIRPNESAGLVLIQR